MEMKATVNSRLMQLMSNRKPITSNSKAAHGQILLLAEAYNTPWTVAYHNPRPSRRWCVGAMRFCVRT